MGKRQLAVHTASNPSLYVSEETRSNRLMRAANFDQGLKKSRGLTPQDPEYNLENKLLIEGKNIIVNPRTKTICSYGGTCDCCGKRFKRNKTYIVGAWLQNGEKYCLKSDDKYHWICYSHFTSRSNDDEHVLVEDDSSD